MSRIVHTNIWSAYGYARKVGYEGTEEEFEQGLKKSAEAAGNAEESASTASEAATEAEDARDAAAQSAESASTSEGNALEYANSAAQVLRDAQAVAQTVNAKATEAAGSASRAENYAQTATTKASEATTAAGTATTAATSASGSAQAADASATAAAASETNAAASASSASTSAGSASESADDAAASAAAAQEVKDSIPADYTALSNDVTDLKSHFTDYNVNNVLLPLLKDYNSGKGIVFTKDGTGLKVSGTSTNIVNFNLYYDSFPNWLVLNKQYNLTYIAPNNVKLLIYAYNSENQNVLLYDSTRDGASKIFTFANDYSNKVMIRIRIESGETVDATIQPILALEMTNAQLGEALDSVKSIIEDNDSLYRAIFPKMKASEQTLIADNTDYNTLLASGSYRCSSNESARSMIHGPMPYSHTLYVLQPVTYIRIYQIAFGNTVDTPIMVRNKYTGTNEEPQTGWTDWKSLVNSDNLSDIVELLNMQDEQVAYENLFHNLEYTDATTNGIKFTRFDDIIKVSGTLTGDHAYYHPYYGDVPEWLDNLVNYRVTVVGGNANVRMIIYGYDADDNASEIFNSFTKNTRIITIDTPNNGYTEKTITKIRIRIAVLGSVGDTIEASLLPIIAKAPTNSEAKELIINDSYMSMSMFYKIGVLGDSFASGSMHHPDGSGWTGDYALSWPQILGRQIGADVINFSQGGLSTRTWLTQRDRGLPYLLESDPQQLYIIALGINDDSEINKKDPPTELLGTLDDIKDDYTQNPSTFYGNYGRIVGNIKAHAPYAKIVALSVMRLVERRLDADIEAIANKLGIPFIDITDDPFFTSSYYYNSFYENHPVSYGYAGIAKAVERLVNKCVLENREYFGTYYGLLDDDTSVNPEET